MEFVPSKKFADGFAIREYVQCIADAMATTT
jgi:hypothetical protein